MNPNFRSSKKLCQVLAFCISALAVAQTESPAQDKESDNVVTKDKQHPKDDAGTSDDAALRPTTPSQTPSTNVERSRPNKRTATVKTNKATTKNVNTTMNDQVPTADDQAKGSDHDVNITRQICRNLVDDDSLSTSAKNINITTLGGKVTLRGTVNSQQELTVVRKHARNVVSDTQINNLVEIKP